MGRLLERLLAERVPAANPARAANPVPEISGLARLAEGPLISRDLERRIRQMGARWRYTDAELVEALASAAADAIGWLLLAVDDEALHRKCQQAGMWWPS